MRILQISPFVPYPPRNGGHLSVFGITKYLSKRNHEIDFVCYRKHDNYETAYNGLKKYATPYILDVQTDNNYFDMLRNLLSPVPYNASKYRQTKLRDFLEMYFKKNQVDIVHVDHLHLGWVADYLREWTKAPLVLREQNVEMTIMQRFAERRSNPLIKYYALLQYQKFKKFEPQVCRKFDKCVMISEMDVRRLQRIEPALDAVAIPAGIESELLEYEHMETIPFSLVHMGHLDWYPNLDGLNWFINSIFPRVVDEYPATTLYVYGGGDQRGLLIPEKVRDNIKIMGYVDNIWKEILNKTLAIVPLRIGSGIRLKILEMLAVGMPIITTPIGKEGIEVQDNEHLLIAE